MFLAILKLVIANALNKEALENLGLFILQFLSEKYLKVRPLTEEEKKELEEAHRKSAETGNSYFYEKALNPNRKFPTN